MPGTAFVTRPSAIFQGFLLGLFLEGAGRWGFDSILETPASLIGDGTLGTSLPKFLTNSTNFVQAVSEGVVSWMSVEQAGDSTDGWDGYEVLLNDVLVQTGGATNYSIRALNTSLPHFFRYVLRESVSLSQCIARSLVRFSSTIADAPLLVPFLRLVSRIRKEGVREIS